MNRIKLISVNLGLLLFFALHPYPRWFMPEGLFQIVFLFTTTISSIELRRNIRKGLVVDKYRIGICIAAVTFLLFFTRFQDRTFCILFDIHTDYFLQ